MPGERLLWLGLPYPGERARRLADPCVRDPASDVCWARLLLLLAAEDGRGRLAKAPSFAGALVPRPTIVAALPGRFSCRCNRLLLLLLLLLSSCRLPPTPWRSTLRAL